MWTVGQKFLNVLLCRFVLMPWGVQQHSFMFVASAFIPLFFHFFLQLQERLHDEKIDHYQEELPNLISRNADILSRQGIKEKIETMHGWDINHCHVFNSKEQGLQLKLITSCQHPYLMKSNSKGFLFIWQQNQFLSNDLFISLQKGPILHWFKGCWWPKLHCTSSKVAMALEQVLEFESAPSTFELDYVQGSAVTAWICSAGLGMHVICPQVACTALLLHKGRGTHSIDSWSMSLHDCTCTTNEVQNVLGPSWTNVTQYTLYKQIIKIFLLSRDYWVEAYSWKHLLHSLQMSRYFVSLSEISESFFGRNVGSIQEGAFIFNSHSSTIALASTASEGSKSCWAIIKNSIYV